MSALKPVLLLEINEIPWRFLDRYLADPRFPNLRAFFADAETFTTHAAPTDVLQPWTTWPSFHRGLPQSGHGIHHLSQDPGTFRGTPIWDEFRARGLDVGVCGSLQSWPPRDPGPRGFWIPDTFARDARCIPSFAEPLQAFNLGLVQENGRVPNPGVGPKRALLELALSLPRLGIRPRTVVRIARQLAGERRDPKRVARRTTFQTILFWDVFRKLYDPVRPPAFTTFFTNHVASQMHRFWNQVFPEDFEELGASAATPHRETVDFAMSVTDEILRDALAYARANPDLRVVVATSMGQHAVRYEEYEGYEAAVNDLGRLLDACGMRRDQWSPALAMVPQVALVCRDAALRARLASVLRAARVPSKQLFSADEVGETLSVTIHVPRLSDIERGTFELGSVDGGPPRDIRFESAGCSMLAVETGSGHHMPEGILAVHGQGVAPNDARKALQATDAKRFLMELANLH